MFLSYFYLPKLSPLPSQGPVKVTKKILNLLAYLSCRKIAVNIGDKSLVATLYKSKLINKLWSNSLDKENKSFRFFCICRKHSKWIKCHEILNASQSHTHHAANRAPTKHLSLSVFPDNGGGSSGHLKRKHQHRESKWIRLCDCICAGTHVCASTTQNPLTHTEKQSVCFTRMLTLPRLKRLKPSLQSHNKCHKRWTANNVWCQRSCMVTSHLRLVAVDTGSDQLRHITVG